MNETKLLSLIGAKEVAFMETEQLNHFVGGPAGYLGPMNVHSYDAQSWPELRAHLLTKPQQVVTSAVRTAVVLDQALEGRRNLVCGANQLDHHYRNVTPGRDFSWTVMADIRNANEGEDAPDAPEGVRAPLRIGKAVEIGHIFKLGYRYTEALGARVLDRNGKEVAPIMGSYGIGIERILTAAIEQSAQQKPDEHGFTLPRAIAPFEVVVTVTNVRDAGLLEAGERLAAELEAAGVDVLLDDRDERAGVKFKDADLVGIPLRVVVGKKAAEGVVELLDRVRGTLEEVALHEVASRIAPR